MPSRILFTSDLNSRRELYAELVRWAERTRSTAVLLGGDLFEGDPHAQVQFARGPFLATVARLRDAGVERIGILPGNSDWDAAFVALRQAAPAGVHFLADAPLDLGGGVEAIGYAFVPLTPFCAKDHERLDHAQPDKSEVLDGVATGISTRSGTTSHVTLPTDGTESIAADLAQLAPQVVAGRTIFVSHCPPRGTGLDLVFGRHAGSQAIRDFLEATRPAVSLHGHCTALEQRGGVFAAQLGSTWVVNPGQGRALHAVVFDAAAPGASLAHTVIGPAPGAAHEPPPASVPAAAPRNAARGAARLAR